MRVEGLPRILFEGVVYPRVPTDTDPLFARLQRCGVAHDQQYGIRGGRGRPVLLVCDHQVEPSRRQHYLVKCPLSLMIRIALLGPYSIVVVIPDGEMEGQAGPSGSGDPDGLPIDNRLAGGFGDFDITL